MSPLNQHCVRYQESQEDTHILDEDLWPKQSVSIEQQPSFFTWRLYLVCLLVLVTLKPNNVLADQPNFDSHSNQDVLDVSAHSPANKKKPPPPEDPAPPPPPEGQQHPGYPKSQASLIQLAHRLKPHHQFCFEDFGTNSGLGITDPFPLAPQQHHGSSSVVPSPSSLCLFILAARHRRRRMTYGARPNHGCLHNHFVRSSPGPNNQSRGIP